MTSSVVAFMKFGGLSGLGWALDFTVLLTLVGLGAPAMLANVASNCVAALCVFLISRQFIFEGRKEALELRVAVYFFYILVMIAISAAALGLIVDELDYISWVRNARLAPMVKVAIAKIIVTPPLLLCNFLMSRHTSERKLTARAWR